MCMLTDPDCDESLLEYSRRFMMTPRPVMEKELKTQEKELTDDINNLNKKVLYSVSYTYHPLADPFNRPNILKRPSTKLKLS